ncbi:MAG: hypothetical protein IPL49_12400 [Saprospirales bacterium]|nr:hypothetical protein [Saprospirales bacterium]MBK8491651.1 hypothetical protein [Saprospirales bacterium]
MDPSPQKQLVENARESYQQFDRFLTIQESDSRLVAAGKMTLRVLGIILMILLSPFLFIGLFIAFIAVF